MMENRAETERLTSLRDVLDSLSLLLKYGEYTLEEIQNELEQSYNRVVLPKGPEVAEIESALPTTAVNFLSAMLARWHNDPDYVDENGEPLPIRPRGDAPSLESLYEKVCQTKPDDEGGISVDDAISRLKGHDSVSENDAGELYPRSVVFHVQRESDIGVTAQLGYFAEFGRTIAYNAIRGKGEGLFQYVARNENIPVSIIPMIHAILEDKGIELLKEVDNYMGSEQMKKGTWDDLETVVVGIYMGVSGRQAG
jgi:hypothetical protein